MLLLPAAMAIMLDSRLGPVPCALDSSFPQRRLNEASRQTLRVRTVERLR
jgi:hypothetical protein